MTTLKQTTSQVLLVLIMVSTLIACGKKSVPGSSGDSCNILSFSGSANPQFNALGVFTLSPVDPSAINFIIPLGNLNPPGHTYPTDHMYFVLKNSNVDVNTVLAAASGTVVDLYQPGGTDWKVVIKVDQSFYYYYDHIHIAPGIKKGSTIVVGQAMGTNSGNAAAIDFGVYNYNNAPLAGVLDRCLQESESYADSAIKYYSGSTQATLYELSGSTYGKIDYDEAGKLVGDWALSGHEALESNAVGLAFVYHVGSSSLRIAVGGTLTGGAMTYAVQDNAPDFKIITPGSGQINYQLYPSINGDDSVSGVQYGVLAVQMISDTQIKVEIFTGTGSTATFDGNAQIYNR